jgi:hypothetical protein
MSQQLDLSRVVAASCAAYAYLVRPPTTGGSGAAPQRRDPTSKSTMSATHRSPARVRRLSKDGRVLTDRLAAPAERTRQLADHMV